MSTWKGNKCNSYDYFFTGSVKPEALMMGQSKKYPQCEDGVIEEDGNGFVICAD